MTTFNPLDYPISLVYPARVTLSWWSEHIPFAMTLIDMLRPRVVVELGTFYGGSYCAFCQAITQLGLGSRAYAVDNWKGDPHAGFYGPEILNDLRAHHDPLYSGFSRLIAAEFDDALAHFNDGSIDLLHIDGYHTYDAVRHDFDNWLPKMSECGVMLFHDVNARQADFGVWRFWEEVRAKYPAFEFAHQHGLGVLAVGAEGARRLQPLLEASEEEAARIREYFFQLGQRISQRWERTQEVRDLHAELNQQRGVFQGQLAEQQAALADCQARLVQAEQRGADEQRRRTEAEQALATLSRDVDEARRQLRAAGERSAQQALALESLRLQLTECQVVLGTRTEQNARLEILAGALTGEIAAIKASLVWRCGHRLSRAARKLAPPGTWRGATLRIGRRGATVVHRHGVRPLLRLVRRLVPRRPAGQVSDLPHDNRPAGQISEPPHGNGLLFPREGSLIGPTSRAA